LVGAVLTVTVLISICNPQGQQSKADYQHEKLMAKIKEIKGEALNKCKSDIHQAAIRIRTQHIFNRKK
jgi:hypothetical protein